MSVGHLRYSWWTEGDAVWVRHDCDDSVDEWRLPPPWRLNAVGGITPSLDCQRCGAHSILAACDRIAPPTDEVTSHTETTK